MCIRDRVGWIYCQQANDHSRDQQQISSLNRPDLVLQRAVKLKSIFLGPFAILFLDEIKLIFKLKYLKLLAVHETFLLITLHTSFYEVHLILQNKYISHFNKRWPNQKFKQRTLYHCTPHPTMFMVKTWQQSEHGQVLATHRVANWCPRLSLMWTISNPPWWRSRCVTRPTRPKLWPPVTMHTLPVIAPAQSLTAACIVSKSRHPLHFKIIPTNIANYR